MKSAGVRNRESSDLNHDSMGSEGQKHRPEAGCGGALL